jgi:hypothetical protein
MLLLIRTKCGKLRGLTGVRLCFNGEYLTVLLTLFLPTSAETPNSIHLEVYLTLTCNALFPSPCHANKRTRSHDPLLFTSHCKSFNRLVANAAPTVLIAPMNRQTAMAFGPSVP